MQKLSENYYMHVKKIDEKNNKNIFENTTFKNLTDEKDISFIITEDNETWYLKVESFDWKKISIKMPVWA